MGTMGQFGFFDADRRLAAITAKGDPLEMIARVVRFESFRAEIEAAVLTPVSEKKSSAGRKPIDVMVMFRMLMLQSLYNLSDEQVDYQGRDRLSFTRFLRLGIEDGIPDGTTLWLFRETLEKAGPRATLRAAARWLMPRWCHFSACRPAYSRRAASSPPALLPLIIVLAVLPRIVELAAAPARIAIWGVPVAPAIEAEEVVVPGVTAGNGDLGRAAHREAALRPVV
jgi:hypothetical protein